MSAHSSNNHNNNQQQYGGGPAELAGDGPSPHPLQSHPLQSHPLQSHPVSATSPAQQNPPAELPAEEKQAQQSQQQQQQYFPPPPPGPPPNQIHLTEDGHPDVPPPSYADIDGAGSGFLDEKRPALPPRPASGQGRAAGSASPAQQAVPLFAPPPKSPNLSSKPSDEQLPEHYNPQPYDPQHYAPPVSPGVAGPVPAQTAAAGNAPSKQHSGGFGQKLYQWGLKAGGPINKLTNRLGSESFWPDTMDKECDKAARILKSFCKDGFYTTPSKKPSTSGPSSESKVLVQIPRSAIANAAGLAIFTTFRAGMHISGAGGSGIVMARLSDGSWSPPSGFLVHTLGAGINIGLDIYDCVCVLNTQAAVDAFTRPRLSLGGEVSVVAGPVGAGASVETALGGGARYNSGKAGDTTTADAKDKGKGKGKGCSVAPVWSYMKSRGFYAGVQADGTIIIQRPDANAAFYGERGITVEKILSGNVQSHAPGAAQGRKEGDIVMWPEGARQLVEVLKAAEGKGADPNVMSKLSAQPTPGDLAVSPGAASEMGTGTGAQGPPPNADGAKTGSAPRYG
ncbi:hypothetical protein F4810DRAFT_718152 [Camillea tinctor]|nr:hypothetical protein F4810DRAFT_718152 [Camillea tinctor]